MKKTIIPILAAPALAALALAAFVYGCTKENDNGGSRTGTAALSISSVTADRMPVKSVITETTLSSGEIGLFLTATDGGNYDGKTSDSPIMLSATEGVLYGYFPYNSSANDLTAIPVESSLNGTDYLYTAPVTGVNMKNPSVSLTMTHALARLSVKFVKATSYTGAGVLTALSLEGPCISSEGTLDAITGNVTATGTNSASYTVTETLTDSETTEECLLVPTTDSDRSLTLKCTIDGREFSAVFDGAAADTLIIRQGVNSTATVTLKDKGISVSGVGIADWGAGNSPTVELDGGHKVTVKRSDETGIADDVFFDVTSDGSTVTIRTHAALTGRFTKCTCTPDGKASCDSSINEMTGIFTFTISDVQEDITAEVGYMKCNAAAVYDSDLGTVKLNGAAVDSGTPVQFFGGDEVTFLAEAKSGCRFLKWTDGSGADLSTDNPFTISKMTSDITLNAVFGELMEISAKVKPAGAGTVTGAGTYPKGSNITLTAIPGGSGAEFIGWVNQNATADTIKQNLYSFTVSQPASYVAVFKLTEALPGLFTVNDSGKKVQFSKGNLWCDADYNPTNSDFHFETNQYDSNPTTDYTGRSTSHISHFMWCRSASEAVKQTYSETGTGSSDKFFTDSDDFAVNGVSSWRTLTGGNSGEWKYLLDSRNTAYGANRRYAEVKVKGMPGLLIFPDDFSSWPSGAGDEPQTFNTYSSDWNDKNYSDTEFKVLQDNGCVFLPAAGYRTGASGLPYPAFVGDVGYYGSYCSASPYGGSNAFVLSFLSGNVDPSFDINRDRASSVRLVTECQ